MMGLEGGGARGEEDGGHGESGGRGVVVFGRGHYQ